MADRSDPFDGIADLLEGLARQLEAAARSLKSERGTESESSAAANAETTATADTRQRIDLSTRASSASTATTAATSLECTDEGDAFVVTVDVPGYETDDLEIRLSGSTLSIRGERERERSDTAAQYVRREREVQSFSRQLTLPEPVAEDDVDATVNNGMLTVRLPKRDPSDDAASIDIE